MGKTIKRAFQCQVCGQVMIKDPKQECGPSLLTGDRSPFHHGQPMLEVVDQ